MFLSNVFNNDIVEPLSLKENYMETIDRTFKSPYHRETWTLAEQRRIAIKEERSKGRTWTDIAKDFGITPQRAQQLGKS